ncbi:hypothetical protein ACWDA9_32525 [Streptomyces sp. NPDC001193]
MSRTRNRSRLLTALVFAAAMPARQDPRPYGRDHHEGSEERSERDRMDAVEDQALLNAFSQAERAAGKITGRKDKAEEDILKKI